jgi:phosphate transport system permease protein
LSIVMLPLIARASQEVLLLVPGSLREAADALGVNRWRTVLSVILPAAMGGIVTGAILAIARAAGETAPLLICDSIFNPNATSFNLFRGVPSVPMFIYTSFDLPLAQAVDRVWGAALVLMMFILLANIGARLLLARSRAKMGQ